VADGQVIAVRFQRQWRPARRTVLHAYTATEIVGGSLALAWAILARPVSPAISIGGPGQTWTLAAGVAFWSAFCLIGGTRVGSIHGYGVLTFHMPFILAAAALGGPAAGGIVAFVGTLELRELRDAPWYGLLANHSALALSGVAAGLAMASASGWFAPLALGADAVALAAFVVGAAVFVLISVSLAAGTSMIRDEAKAFHAYMGAFRTTMVTEVIVGWLLALLYGSVAPWAALLGGVVVLQLVRLIGEREFDDRDPLVPGLLTYEAFRHRADSLARYRPVGYLILTVEGWTGYVEACGREAAEELTKLIGETVVASLFTRDIATHSGAGEWRVLLARPGLGGVLIAARKHWRAMTQAITGMTCPGGPSLAIRIGAGLADDDTDHGPMLVVARAEQARFHGLREQVAITVRGGGWTTWDPEPTR
jgi:hypothetical protein